MDGLTLPACGNRKGSQSGHLAPEHDVAVKTKCSQHNAFTCHFFILIQSPQIKRAAHVPLVCSLFQSMHNSCPPARWQWQVITVGRSRRVTGNGVRRQAGVKQRSTAIDQAEYRFAGASRHLDTHQLKSYEE
jgi:hypothetical protein